jgi:predicted membrane protein
MNNNPNEDDRLGKRPPEPDDLGYADWSQWRWRRRRRRGPLVSRVFFAVFLIAVGTLLFLGNIGVLPIHDVWDYWPLILVAVGITRLFECRSTFGIIAGALLIVFGSLFLLISLGIFHLHMRDSSWPLALLLIAFGIVALIKTAESNTTGRHGLGFPRPIVDPSDNALHEQVVGGAIKRRLETPNFIGGEINCVFGSVEIDLRRAQIASKEATVEVHCVFGAVKIRVPEDWRVSIQGAGVFGTFEDKTIPPRSGELLAASSLIIAGGSVFSSVELEN